MGFSPASQALALVALFVLIRLSYGLDSWQVGNPDAGIDIRTPLDAFTCDRWLVYYKVAPTEYGRSLGVNYDDISLHLTTPDSARTLLVKIDIPRGEGVISWTVNMKPYTQFFINPHGPLPNGDYVQVKRGGGGEACLSYTTRTLDDFVTYNPSAFHSVQEHSYAISNRPLWFARMTSPEAGLQTHFAPAGVIVSPAPTSTPDSTPTPTGPTAGLSTSDSDSDSSQTSSEHESTSSQSGSSTRSGSSTITHIPVSSGDAFAPSAPSTASVPATDAGGQQHNSTEPELGRASQNKLPIIVGGVVGGAFLLLAILCYFLLTRRRHARVLRETSAPFVQIDSQRYATTAGTRASTGSVELDRRDEAPARGITRSWYFNSESVSAPTESDFDTRASTTGVPMDLARALEVVAAHVRSGEVAHDGPGGAPPDYSPTEISRTTRGTTTRPSPSEKSQTPFLW